MKFIIPARRNSKGLPFKNRKLLHSTLDGIPAEFRPDVIVSTDDEEIIKTCDGQGVFIHNRKPELCEDETSMKDVLLNIIEEKKIYEDVILLYLTYPQRDFEDILSIYNYCFLKYKLESLLCCKTPVDHPYLCLYSIGDNRGKQIVDHNLYRRQTYPKMICISHYVGIFKWNIIKNLNNNLYNSSTYYYNIDDLGNIIDVDREADLNKWSGV